MPKNPHPVQYLVHLLDGEQQQPMGTYAHRESDPLNAALRHFNEKGSQHAGVYVPRVGDYFVVQDLQQLFAGPGTVFRMAEHSFEPVFDRRFDPSKMSLLGLFEVILDEALAGQIPPVDLTQPVEFGDLRNQNYHDMPWN